MSPSTLSGPYFLGALENLKIEHCPFYPKTCLAAQCELCKTERMKTRHFRLCGLLRENPIQFSKKNKKTFQIFPLCVLGAKFQGFEAGHVDAMPEASRAPKQHGTDGGCMIGQPSPAVPSERGGQCTSRHATHSHRNRLHPYSDHIRRNTSTGAGFGSTIRRSNTPNTF